MRLHPLYESSIGSEDADHAGKSGNKIWHIWKFALNKMEALVHRFQDENLGEVWQYPISLKSKDKGTKLISGLDQHSILALKSVNHDQQDEQSSLAARNRKVGQATEVCVAEK